MTYDKLARTKGKKSRGEGARTAAKRIRCDPHLVQAFANIESREGPYDDKGRLIILPEKHQFWKHLPTSKRRQAERLGLGHKGWRRSTQYKGLGRTGKSGADARWGLLGKMAALDERAALMSASVGTFQIMGFNYKICGYDSVVEFWTAMATSEDNQVEAFVRFVEGRGLADEMREMDIEAVVRGYNGPGQVSSYSSRIRAEYKRLTGGKVAKVTKSVRVGSLRMGSRGYRVRALQERLSELGYATRVDGDFGGGTRRQVRLFQLEQGIKADGIVGPATQAKLDAAESVVPEEREFATARDLKKTSSIVSSADKVKKVAAAVGVSVLGGKGAEETGILDQARDLADKGEQVVGVWEKLRGFSAPLAGLLEMVGSNLWFFVPVGCLFVWLFAGKAIRSRLRDHQTWKTT